MAFTTDKGFLRGPSTPIISRPASKEYLESPLWNNFGPDARKPKDSNASSKTSVSDQSQQTATEETQCQ